LSRSTRILFRVLVYALFSLAAAWFLLALLCGVGGVGLWLGLREMGGLHLAALFVAGGLVAIGLGFLAHALELRVATSAPAAAPRADTPPGDGPHAVPTPGADADDAPLDAPP
jgi:hypothetical protein